MIVYKKKSRLRTVFLVVYTISIFLVFIINSLLLIKENNFNIEVIYSILIFSVIFLFFLIQLILTLNTKREIIIEGNCVLIKKVFFTKKIIFYSKSEILIEDFKKKHDNDFIKSILFKIFNINTSYAVLIKDNSSTKKIIINLNKNSAVELAMFIKSNIK